MPAKTKHRIIIDTNLWINFLQNKTFEIDRDNTFKEKRVRPRNFNQMTIIYIFLSLLAILLIVNIILTLKAGKKEAGNELTEIKSSIGTLTSNLKDTEKTSKMNL